MEFKLRITIKIMIIAIVRIYPVWNLNNGFGGEAEGGNAVRIYPVWNLNLLYSYLCFYISFR